ncbi:hypothetical protein G9298_30235 (plasmid) [Bacillus thuringiensis]|nr:hypothetical protein G9298_30235 [Bacillus thuringiensis]
MNENGLKQIIDIFGLPQSSVANVIAVSPKTFNDWIKRRRGIPKARLNLLAEFFDIPAEYFQKELSLFEKSEVEKKMEEVEFKVKELKLQGIGSEKYSLEVSPIVKMFLAGETNQEELIDVENLFVTPAVDDRSQENRAKTLDKNININMLLSDVSLVSKNLSEQSYMEDNSYALKVLNNKNKQKIGVKAWGSRDAKAIWEAINVHKDKIIISTKTSTMTHYGTLIAKVYSPVLSQFLWESSEFKYIYFIDQVKEIEVPNSKLNECFGYQPNRTYQTFTRLKYIQEKKGIRDKVLKQGLDKLIGDLNKKQIDEKKRRQKAEKKVQRFIHEVGVEKFEEIIKDQDFEVIEEQKFQDEINNLKEVIERIHEEDKPVSPKKIISSVSKLWYRNPSVSALALRRANFKCEIDDAHATFLSPKTGNNFVEAHHLIPLKLQGDKMYKDISLDVPANIVALCPNDHRKIHYSDISVKKEMILDLINKRRSRLGEAGIKIDMDKIFNAYGIKDQK